MTNATPLAAPPLSLAEQTELDNLERTIESGFKIFLEVGEALALIREKKLYRARYSTFEAYCQERWKFTRQRAYQLMSAAQLAFGMSTVVDIPNERIARELSRLERPEDQRTAASIAVATAPDGKLSQEWVAGTVDVFQDAMHTDGLVNTGTGDYAALNAAITNEVHQTMIEKRDQLKHRRTKPDAVIETTYAMSAADVATAIEGISRDLEARYRVVIYKLA